MINAANATSSKSARELMFSDCDQIERSIRRAGLFTSEEIESIPSPADESRALDIINAITL